MDYEGFFKQRLDGCTPKGGTGSSPISNGAAAVFRAPSTTASAPRCGMASRNTQKPRAGVLADAYTLAHQNPLLRRGAGTGSQAARARQQGAAMLLFIRSRFCLSSGAAAAGLIATAMALAA